MERSLLVIDDKLFETIAVTDAIIAQMAEQYLSLKINGIEDKDGFKKVHDARMVVKGTRVKVENKRKELKGDALRYGQAIDEEANRIKGLLLPIEDHLVTEEQAIIDALEAITKEKERQEELRIQVRRDRLAALGIAFNGQVWICDMPHSGIKALPDVMVRSLTDSQFEEQIFLFNRIIAKEKRFADEEEVKRKEETECLAKIAVEQEAERQRLAEVARKQEEESNYLKAEQKKIEDARQKILDDAIHAQELEKARKEGAEKALKDAEEFARQNALKLAEADRLAKIVAEKKEAWRPDKERLLTFAKTEYFFPDMKTAEGKAIISTFKIGITGLIETLRKAAEAL
ncbi:MAG: hypothetical protein Q8J68_14640 [Methanolobus sp.]|uniref:hypothetical protein n=1 Tax=Methanolobus sp. TaxID=1874737 RepID=UPI002730E36B|nr:hypothetical protein [Methanolobus sp.]MDP2218512.1 hypothetical protein [Methanolobus sp.]